MNRTAKLIAAAMLGLLLAVAVSQRTGKETKPDQRESRAETTGTARNEGPVPGGGSHEMTGIWILTFEPTNSLDPGQNLTNLTAGQELGLRVMLGWAIPYVEEVTSKAQLWTDHPECAELRTGAVLVAKSPGTITVHAKYARFEDTLRLNIREANQKP